MASLKTLKPRLNRLHDKIERQANEIAKDTARVVLETIVVKMPVDTSKAVSNWHVAYDTGANVQVMEPTYPGKGGDTRDQASKETLFIGKLYIDGKQIRQELHIANRVEYIDDINNYNVSGEIGFKESGIRAGEEFAAKQKLDLKL